MTIAIAGCGAADPQAPAMTATARYERIQKLDHDLGLGSTGEDVRAIHSYLTRFGYFPNEELARQYPAWRPLVDEGPNDETVFDHHTVDAIRKLQIKSGLPETGIVDESTRAVLRLGRCGEPEGISKIDPSSKFSLDSIPAPMPHTVFWQVSFGVTAEAAQRLDEAFTRWQGQTDLTFFPDSGRGNIGIDFASLDDGTLGETSPPCNCAFRTIHFNSNVSWWMGQGPPPFGQTDFLTVATHEIGHALGLGHSSATGAVMVGITPSGLRRPLTVDDKVAISTLYDSWDQNVPGGARDIAAGASPLNDVNDVWIIGTNSAIYKWRGSDALGWAQDQAGGVASRIAVTSPNGIPWVVNAAGSVYRRTTNDPTTGTWQNLPGVLARDIGAGADGSVWIMSLSTQQANSEPFKWNGTNPLNGTATGSWQIDGAIQGMTIAVDAIGRPYALKSDFSTWRRTSGNLGSGSWQPLPNSATLRDIGVGPGATDTSGNHIPYAWAIGPNAVGSGDFSIHVWDEQSFDPNAGPPAPAGAGWIPFGGGAVRITVDKNGNPWVVNAGGHIYRTTK
jgi:hypothetical protein